jgi:hypothetical protein
MGREIVRHTNRLLRPIAVTAPELMRGGQSFAGSLMLANISAGLSPTGSPPRAPAGSHGGPIATAGAAGQHRA